jgi:hypothetical protein
MHARPFEREGVSICTEGRPSRRPLIGADYRLWVAIKEVSKDTMSQVGHFMAESIHYKD